MLKYLLFTLLSFNLQFSFAAERTCTLLAEKLHGVDDNYRPPLEGKVIGNKRLYIYTAPDLQCKIHDVFVIEGDSLTVYRPYKKWLQVMFIAKNGEDYLGWVSTEKVKIIGQYGFNP